MPVEPIHSVSAYWEKALDSAILAILVAMLYIFIRSIIKGKIKDAHQYLWKKVADYTGLLTAILLLGCIWIEDTWPVVTFLGILTAALAIVYKTVLMSLAGGLVISRQGLFSIGDRIQAGKHRGDVIGMGPLYFTLFEVGDAASGHQSTGRILKIPNNLILNTSIVNHSKFFPHIWHELAIVLKPDANWVKAKAIMQQLTEKHTKMYEASARATIQNSKKRAPIIHHKTGPKVYITLQYETPAGIRLTSRFLCEAHTIRETEMLIYEELLTRFNKEVDIRFAFDMSPEFSSAENPSGKDG